MAEVYRAHYGGRQRNIGFNNLRALINLDTLTVGTKLFASPPSREPQWQPIETAPKDGKVVLLGYHNSHGNWRTMRGCWLSKDYIDEYWEYPEGVDAGWFETPVEAEDPPNCWPTDPTHWMPLPPPPGIHSREGEKA